MPNQERRFAVGSREYAIRFTQNALYRLQKQLGRPLAEIRNSAGPVEIQTMLWAGLEGARLKSRDRKEPFTLDEAGDLIDELGGLAAAAEIVADGLRLVVLAAADSDGNGAQTENPTMATAKA